jgi:hypothetical protein
MKYCPENMIGGPSVTAQVWDQWPDDLRGLDDGHSILVAGLGGSLEPEGDLGRPRLTGHRYVVRHPAGRGAIRMKLPPHGQRWKPQSSPLRIDIHALLVHTT